MRIGYTRNMKIMLSGVLLASLLSLSSGGQTFRLKSSGGDLYGPFEIQPGAILKLNGQQYEVELLQNDLEIRARSIILSTVEFRQAMCRDAFHALVRLADTQDPDTGIINLVLTPAPHPNLPDPYRVPVSLHLRDISLHDALGYLCQVAGLSCRYDTEAVVIEPTAATSKPPPPPPAAARMQKRARSIILPVVEFRHANWRDCFQFYRDAAKAHDPDGIGINFVLVNPPEANNDPFTDDDPFAGDAFSDPFGAAAIPAITLQLRQVSLYDAIRYTCEVSGLESIYEEHAIRIRPPDPHPFSSP